MVRADFLSLSPTKKFLDQDSGRGMSTNSMLSESDRWLTNLPHGKHGFIDEFVPRPKLNHPNSSLPLTLSGLHPDRASGKP
jgi:hypothetical protein